jgi:hypothetical protein
VKTQIIDIGYADAVNDDWDFFEQYPKRRHRIRAAAPAEIEEFAALGCVIGEKHRPCMAVRIRGDQIARTLIGAPKDLANPSAVPEEKARAIFELGLRRLS